ncbi:MAG: hypothetical protein HZA31_11310 [Opitutae bacterium]|nr:hypothetical protein [Opitutae bacterium]
MNRPSPSPDHRRVRPFHAVYFEIVSGCNARCAYCHSGVQRVARMRFVETAVFRASLQRLLTAQAIAPGTVISLYNWGEPLLHPRLPELVGVIDELRLRYAISTNASRPLAASPALVRNLDHLIFSMPGFSQAAYDRIHGFVFPEIVRNIEGMLRDCRAHGFRGRGVISYHVYRFNVAELRAAERFADRLRLEFNPYFAILNHWWELNAYRQDQLPPERRAEAERDLFTLDGMAAALAAAPKAGYRCPQNDYLVLDENGRIVTCCQIARDHPDFACGSALHDDIPALLRRRTRQPVCAECIGSGLAHYLNTALRRPDFYRPSLRQRIMHLKTRLQRVLKRIGRN